RAHAAGDGRALRPPGTRARHRPVRDVRADRGHRPDGVPAAGARGDPPRRRRRRDPGRGAQAPPAARGGGPEWPEGSGLVVYRGPNVMMGYAESPVELADPPSVDELVTGDVGRFDEAGLLHLEGRRSRFTKIF